MALIHCDFFSEVLGVSTSMDVILPQATSGQIGMTGTASQGDAKCLYLLHGYSDDHTIWQRRTSIERYAASSGLAVVMPAVHKSFYADMVSGDRYWTFISEEVPALARSFFHLSDRREDNFVAGLSMGGYGAFKLALNCPEKFSAAASLSGSLNLAERVSVLDDRLGNEVELVFGKNADIRGTSDDLFYCSEQVAALSQEKRPMLYQCCGLEDRLYDGNVRFRDHAQSLGLDLTYEEGPGGHEWGYWDLQIQKVFEWLEGKDLSQPSGVDAKRLKTAIPSEE
ncbi:MAG: esterase family protein [Kiritimatiellae bacterium]|nr:esterase family protein [Kiritimatiellia bacterium]